MNAFRLHRAWLALLALTLPLLSSAPVAQANENDADAAAPITHHIYVHIVPAEEAGDLHIQVDVVESADRVVAAAEAKPKADEAAAPAPEPPVEAQPAVPVPDEEKKDKEDAAAAAPTHRAPANMGLLFFVFVLAILAGFELISRVPSQLHTPLMSGSNAISGITIVGALMAVGRAEGAALVVLGTLAVIFAMINVVGGYLVTDRMLAMFKHKGGESA